MADSNKDEFQVTASELSSISELRPRIDGNNTLQSSLIPISMLDQSAESEVPQEGNRFRILTMSNGTNGCKVFADLSSVTDGYVAGTTIGLEIVFDSTRDKNLEPQQAEAIAKWATHVAYDFAALSLRQICANNPIVKELDLPLHPIVPKIDIYLDDSDER